MCLFFCASKKKFCATKFLLKKVLHKIFEAMHRLSCDCQLTMVSVQHTMRFIKLFRFGAFRSSRKRPPARKFLFLALGAGNMLQIRLGEYKAKNEVRPSYGC